MVISKCEDCNHRNICKYKEEYDKILREIDVKVPDPFTLILNCKHYYSTVCYLNSDSMHSSWATQCSNTLASPYIPGSPEVTY